MKFETDQEFYYEFHTQYSIQSGDNMDKIGLPLGKRQRKAQVGVGIGIVSQVNKPLHKSTEMKIPTESSQPRKRKRPDDSVGRVGQGEYLVENILDTRINEAGVREYFVKWLDWESVYNSWEPEENVAGCLVLVQKFWEEKKAKIPTATSILPKSPENIVSANVQRIPNTQMKNKISKVSSGQPIISVIKPPETVDKTVNKSAAVIPTSKENETIKSENESLQIMDFVLQKRIRIMQNNLIFTVTTDVLLKNPCEAPFEFVVTAKLAGRKVKKIYEKSMESEGINYVICEFEGSNLLEVVPQSCFNKTLFICKNPASKM